MLSQILQADRRTSTMLCATAVLALGLAGCGTTAAQQHANFDRDAGTCADFGSRVGSRAYSDCMLAQQSRRDNATNNQLEQMRMVSEIAKDGQIMTERARRDRCRRDPDRRECNR